MRRDSINYLVVGTFVLVVFVLLLGMLYKITGRTGPTDSYFVTYGNVEGIKYGTPVLYEGYQIGQVDKLEPVRAAAGTRFKLELAVTKGWSIPGDSIAKVVKSGLLSAVAIDIKEGKSAQALDVGAELKGEEASDIFAAVNDVAADIHNLTRESLRPLLDNLNEKANLLTADIRGLVDDSMRPLLDKDAKDLLQKLNKSADGLSKVLNEENQENLNRIISNLADASSELNGLMQRVETSRAALDKLVADLDNVVGDNDEDVRAIVKDLQKSLYAISQHIDAVAHNMEGSSRNINEFTRQIRENPALLIRGSPQEDQGESK